MPRGQQLSAVFGVQALAQPEELHLEQRLATQRRHGSVVVVERVGLVFSVASQV
jgi:hypothetical protein